MQNFLYYFILGMIWLFAKLPFWILYRFADLFFVLIFYVVRYRRSVTRNNLENSFPDYSAAQIADIEYKFYRHFSDLFVETLKLLTMSRKEAHRRSHFKNPEMVQEMAEQGKSIVMLTGHYGSWEWASIPMGLELAHDGYALFKPQSSKLSERLVNRLRMQNGVKMVSMKHALRQMIRLKNDLTLHAFIADQKPPRQGAQWLTFLNQETAFFTGAEKISRKLKRPVFVALMSKPKRGFYEVHVTKICDDPNDLAEGEVTARFAALLETEIRRRPELWLWSHRRWSLKRHKETEEMSS